MGQLKEWVKQDWVRIGSDGSIKGKCGTSKDKSNPDRCLPRAKANSLSKSERATTARKKKRAGSKGKTTVANTKAAKVTGVRNGGDVKKPKRPITGKAAHGTAGAQRRGAGMSNRRQINRGTVSQT